MTLCSYTSARNPLTTLQPYCITNLNSAIHPSLRDILVDEDDSQPERFDDECVLGGDNGEIYAGDNGDNCTHGSEFVPTDELSADEVTYAGVDDYVIEPITTSEVVSKHPVQRCSLTVALPELGMDREGNARIVSTRKKGLVNGKLVDAENSQISIFGSEETHDVISDRKIEGEFISNMAQRINGDNMDHDDSNSDIGVLSNLLSRKVYHENGGGNREGLLGEIMNKQSEMNYPEVNSEEPIYSVSSFSTCDDREEHVLYNDCLRFDRADFLPSELSEQYCSGNKEFHIKAIHSNHGYVITERESECNYSIDDSCSYALDNGCYDNSRCYGDCCYMANRDSIAPATTGSACRFLPGVGYSTTPANCSISTSWNNGDTSSCQSGESLRLSDFTGSEHSFLGGEYLATLDAHDLQPENSFLDIIGRLTFGIIHHILTPKLFKYYGH